MFHVMQVRRQNIETYAGKLATATRKAEALVKEFESHAAGNIMDGGISRFANLLVPVPFGSVKLAVAEQPHMMQG